MELIAKKSDGKLRNLKSDGKLRNRPTGPFRGRGANRPDKPRSKEDAADFRKLDAVVKDGLHAFLEVGQALAAIRNRRLYRGEFKTFELYLARRHGLKPRRAYQLIEAAEAVSDTNVQNFAQKSLPNEAQARELARLPRDQRAPAWADIAGRAKRTGRTITAATVKDRVSALRLSTSPQIQPDADKTKSTPSPKAQSEKVDQSVDAQIVDVVVTDDGQDTKLSAEETRALSSLGFLAKNADRVFGKLAVSNPASLNAAYRAAKHILEVTSQLGATEKQQ